MRRIKALKTAVLTASAAFFILIPTNTANADDSIYIDQGIAGIAKSLDQLSVDEEAADKVLTEIFNTQIVSIYDHLGVSKASDYVNVRKKPSTESEVVGKLYQGCAADILERLEGNWVKIKSGDVEGYIASDFLAIGDEAEKMADKFATKKATVINTPTLRVRAEQNTDSTTLELIPLGETYIVVKEYDEWVEILLGADDNGNDFTGFVSKDYVTIDVQFKEAVSVEEELRLKKLQEEAERAEAERLQKLAEEKERQRIEAQRKAEAAAKAEKDNNKQQESKPEPIPTNDSGNQSELRSEIASYAQKFVGNPYVWGGESLTRGADCSGFVQTIYRQYGYSIPRVSADQARNAGKEVSVSERKPGDLIFYRNSSGNVNHVAMYIGNDRIVHAANSRQGIITSAFNYRDVYKVRRIIY